jgi:hypothetical protein
MRYLFPLFLILSCLLTFLPGCEPKEDMVQTSGSLEMGADTVLFDTVFTTIKTVTKRLWVYNRNSGAVKTDVSLAGLAGNTFALIINGDAGPAVGGITIRGNDSLQVLVRATLGDNGQATVAKKFIVDDEVHFRTNGNDQSVKLVAYGQNAYFHRADIINKDTTWPTDKPHVIINSNYTDTATKQVYQLGVAVVRGVTLTIPKGARIYSHAGAYLQVDGRLLVGQDFVPGTGAIDTVKATDRNIVRFQGDRLEPSYADTPGQWGGIVFTPTSRGNRISYAEIKNATFGALLLNPDNTAVVHPDLVLKNTVIRNISGANLSFANATSSTGGGIISYSGDVQATNCLFTNCGEYAVLGMGGGVYDFNFCTFANFTPAFRRETSSLTFTNELASNDTKTGLTRVTIRNSIVWGSYEDELFVKNSSAYDLLSITNSVLRTQEYKASADAADKPGLNLPARNNIINEDPLFVRTSLTSSRPDYSLQAASRAATARHAAVGPDVPRRDLLNLPRPANSQTFPTLGAYEHK